MTPRKKVTDATKAKLPLPKGHPQKRPTRKRPTGTAPSLPERVQCPNCEKWIRPGPNDIHTCYDAKALRESLDQTIGALQALEDSVFPPTPSPIAGQPLPEGSAPAPTFEAIPTPAFAAFMTHTLSTAGYREPLYDTRPYPYDFQYPRIIRARFWLSNKLTALAKWVAP